MAAGDRGPHGPERPAGDRGPHGPEPSAGDWPGQPAAGLYPALAGLGFLVGRWRGEGVGGYPTLAADFRYLQELEILPVPGRPVLAHRSRSWDPQTGVRYAGESGWWRPGAGPDMVELLLAHSSGVLELLVGTRAGERVELATDLVARSATAKEVTAGRRLYGRIEADLAYAVDMAAAGHPLQPHLSARLSPAGISGTAPAGSA